MKARMRIWFYIIIASFTLYSLSAQGVTTGGLGAKLQIAMEIRWSVPILLQRTPQVIRPMVPQAGTKDIFLSPI